MLAHYVWYNNTRQVWKRERKDTEGYFMLTNPLSGKVLTATSMELSGRLTIEGK